MTTRTNRASSFLAAAERLGVEVVVGSERAQVLDGENPVGQEVDPPPEGSRCMGFIFAREENAGAVEAAREAHRKLGFRITPEQDGPGRHTIWSTHPS